MILDKRPVLNPCPRFSLSFCFRASPRRTGAGLSRGPRPPGRRLAQPAPRSQRPGRLPPPHPGSFGGLPRVRGPGSTGVRCAPPRVRGQAPPILDLSRPGSLPCHPVVRWLSRQQATYRPGRGGQSPRFRKLLIFGPNAHVGGLRLARRVLRCGRSTAHAFRSAWGPSYPAPKPPG
jgi:hypothetical protein